MGETSVIIWTCNAGRYISTTLESVSRQTCADFEVIVVDEGSTDDTAARVAEWGDRIDYLRIAEVGRGGARNLGLARATGRFVAFLDAGDVWMPHKLERQVAYFHAFPETGLLHTDSIVSRTPVAAMREATERTVDRQAPPPVRVFGDLFHRAIDIHTRTVMIPREMLAEVGGFNEEAESDIADWDLWLRIAASAPTGSLPVPLAVGRPRRSLAGTVETTYRGQEIVIAKMAPLCAAACSRHAGDAATCVRERRYQLSLELGAERFWRGQLPAAAAAFGEARRLRPARPRPYVFLSAARLGRVLLDRSPRARHAFLAASGHRPLIAAQPPANNLVHDTVYRRTRRSIVRAIHTADDILGRVARSRVRVLFEAATPMSFVVFRPILERLQQDPRLEFWFTTSDHSWDAGRLFPTTGITDHVVSTRDVLRMKFDAYVNADFWNMTWLPRGAQRVHLFHGVAGKYSLDAPVGIAPVVASFDRLMFPNRERLLKYAQAGIIDADSPQAALIGYPKVDCLVDGSLDRAAIQRSLGLDPTAPTVLYAPTWSPYSSLHSMGVDVIRALGRLGVNVVVKLHDRSYDRTARGSDGVDWRERLNRLARDWPVHVAEDFDASRYLFVADTIVTDHSSVGFEFMLLDRPVVVIDCPELIEKAHIALDKVRLLRHASAVVTEPNQIARAVRRELDDPDRLSAERRAVAADLFYRPGSATTRAVECLYEVLSLPEPVQLGAADATPSSSLQLPAAFSSCDSSPT
jgi:hypothetical protein